MRAAFLGVLFVGLGLTACKRENPAFIGDLVTTSDSTTSAGTSQGTSATVGSGSTAGSTGGKVCDYGGLGRLNADVFIDGNSAADCGAPFESWGYIETFGAGPMRSFQMCDSKDCTSCAGTFDFLLSGPAGTIPVSGPQCIRVTLEKEFFDANTQSCLFSGVVMSRAEDGVVVVPMFAGSSGVVNPPEGLSIPGSALSVMQHKIDSCDCPECCEAMGQEYELEFMLANETIKLLPTESFETLITDLMYRITNLQSHDAVPCGAPPDIDWTVLDVAFLQ